MPYRRSRLDNGLDVILVPAPNRHLAALGLFVRAGTRFERARDAGLAHFLEHMLFRGAGEHADSFALNRALESLGGPVHASTCRDSTSYLMRMPPGSLEPALALLAAMFTGPRYAGLAAEREIVLEELAAELDEQGNDLEPENLSHPMLYPGHALARRILGEPGNVRRFGRRELERCRGQHYVGANLVAVVAGPIDEQGTLDALQQHLGSLPAGRAAASRTPRPGPRGAGFCHVADDDPQARLRLCFRTPAEDDPAFPALKLALRVLDDGVSSRLQNRICEELGLAYEVSAELVSYGDAGHIALDLAAAPGKMSRAIDELLGLLEGLVRDPARDDELDLARSRYRMDLLGMLDDVWELTQFFGYAGLLGQEPSPRSRWQEIEAVTAEGIEAVARQVIAPERLRAVVVGDLPRRELKACRRLVEGWKGVG